MQSLALLLTLAASAVAIWPIPTQYRHGNAVIWLASDVQMTFNAPSSNAPRSADAVNPRLRRRRDGPSGTAPVSAEVVQAAIRRTHDLIFNEKFVPWKFHPRNADFEPPLAEAKNHISSIVITQNSTDVAGTFKPLAGAVDESYTLEVTEDGRVKMTAVSSVGVLRALDTFTQLFFQHSGDKDKVYTNLAPLYIYDTPKFPHRGLNMDVARNWFPVDDLLHLIDAVSWNKFNRLHLHVTDSQSWPLEIPAIPELADKGAYRKGLSYSPADIERIQRHGTERGVEVFLEIDMPGHTASIAESFPDLITAYDMQPDWPTYANEPPSGQFKLDHPPVMEFLGKLFDDLLPRVSPHAAYFHTGGDEVNRNVYLLDDTVKSNDSAVIQPLLQKFLDGVHEKVRAKGLTPIVWEEMLLQWNLTLGDDVVVQTWQSNEAVADAVRKGHKTLAGNFNYWYLDCGKGQWVSPRDNGSVATPSVIAEPFADYCSPTKSWRQMYSYDPLFNIPAESTHLVLGGEVHMWNEQTDRVSLDHMVWPRAAAAAEVLWSGRKDTAGTNRSLLTAAPRLNEWRERLVARGVAAAPIQMIYCTQNDPSSCGQ